VEVGAGSIAGQGEAIEGNGSSTGEQPENFSGILVNKEVIQLKSFTNIHLERISEDIEEKVFIS
jgi:hypothetical protein